MTASADAQLKAALDESVLVSNLGCKTWGGQTYKDIFTGETLVNILLKDQAKYPSRETAVQYAQELLDTLAITCITKRRTFDDGDRLYCINRKMSRNDDGAARAKMTKKSYAVTKAVPEGKEAASKQTSHESTKNSGERDKVCSILASESRLSNEPMIEPSLRDSTNIFRLLEKDAAKRSVRTSDINVAASTEKTSVKTGQDGISVALKDKQSKARKDETFTSKKMSTVSSRSSCEEKTRGLVLEKAAFGEAFPRRTEPEARSKASFRDTSNVESVTLGCSSEKETSNGSGEHLDSDADNGASVGKQKLSKTLSPALTALIEKDAKNCQTYQKKGGTQEARAKQVDVEDEKTAVADGEDGAAKSEEPSKCWDAFELKLQNKINTQRRSPGRDIRSGQEGFCGSKSVTFQKSVADGERESHNLERRTEKHKTATKEEIPKEQLNLQTKLVVKNDELSMPSVKERKSSFLGLDETGKAKEETNSCDSKTDTGKNEHSKKTMDLQSKSSVNSEELLMPSVKERKNSFLAGLDESGNAKEDNVERKSIPGKVDVGSSRERGVSSFSLREESKPVVIDESAFKTPKEESGSSFSSRGESKPATVDGASLDRNAGKNDAKVLVQRKGSKTLTEFDKSSDSSPNQDDLVRVGEHVMPKTLAALLARDGSSVEKREQGFEQVETNVFKNKLKELKKTGPRSSVPLVISPRPKAQSSAELTRGEPATEQVARKKDEHLDKTGTRHLRNEVNDTEPTNDNTVGKGAALIKTVSVEINVTSTDKAAEKNKATESESGSKTANRLSENSRKGKAESEATGGQLSPRMKPSLEKSPVSPTFEIVIPRLNLDPSLGHDSKSVSRADVLTRPNSLGISSPSSKSTPFSSESVSPSELREKMKKNWEDFEVDKLKYENKITELQLQIDFLRRQKSGQIDANCLDSLASMSDLTSLYSSFSTPMASPGNSNVTSPAITPNVTPRGSMDLVAFSPVSPPPPPPAPPSVPTALTPNGGHIKPTKMVVNPRSDMKPLFWNRIITTSGSGKKGKSMWKNIKEPVIDTTEFERLFSKKGGDRKLKRTKSLRDDKHFAHISGKKVAKLLETNRARAIGIKMSSLNCQLEDIRNAVYNMDTSTVDMESLQFIYDIYPKEEEIQLIEEHVNKLPAVPLDKPEEFMHQLTKMKHFKERLECWLFQEKFSEIVYGIDRCLASVTEGCSIISTNAEIAAILALVLAYGNYMNGNTQRGQADGFHLEVLLKLRDVKTKNADTNLLQYIVKQYLKQHERSAEKGKSDTRFPSSVSLSNAAQVSFHKLKEELLKMSSLLQETETQTKKILDECVPSQRNPLEEKMRKFQKMAKQTLSEENLKMDKAVKTFQETMEYFHWEPNGQKETPQEFFALWAKFIEEVKSCVKLEKQQQYQAKKNFSKVEHLNQIHEAATKFKKRRESIDLL